jgi:peroxiredoxin Q/BCP
MQQDVADFELPNAATGPNPYRFLESADQPDRDAIVLLFQRDYHCPKCRKQVQDVARRYKDFEAANTEAVAILPESVERANDWQSQYSLPFPLLADETKDVSDEYDQPTRFGALVSLHDMVGRMPFAMVFDTRSGTPELVYTHEGTMPGDRPSVDELLDVVRTNVAGDEAAEDLTV